MVFHRFQSKTQEHIFLGVVKQKIEGQNLIF